MDVYCFQRRHGGMCAEYIAIFAQSLAQARHYLRRAEPAWTYLGRNLTHHSSQSMGIALAHDLQRGWESLVANGAGAESLAHYRKRWHFTPESGV